MKVYAKWEFDVDVDDIDKSWVDVEGYARELTEREMKYMLEHGEITANDFTYEVEKTYMATDIIWDDGRPEIILPTEIELPDGMTDYDEVAEYLSDLTGFCVKSFVLE
jgi:hypothetical protein